MSSSLFNLSGKTALITGSSQGIGLAIAEEMGLCGARVVITSHEPDRCAKALDRLLSKGIEAIRVVSDVSIDSDLDYLVAETLRQWPSIDIFVNNAGINAPFGSMLAITDEDYERIMHVNLRSAVQLCRRIIPQMIRQASGSVILMSSLSGLRGNQAIGTYALSKAALAQLARNLAVEFGPHNIRVNAISPGLIATEFSQSMMADTQKLQFRLAKTPLRRVGLAREIAGTAVYLASDAGAFTTGHNLVVDGGTLITD